MRSKQIQRSSARPSPSKVGLSEGVISLEIRCELDYLHSELYFLITATSVPPRIYAFETDKTGLDLEKSDNCGCSFIEI